MSQAAIIAKFKTNNEQLLRDLHSRGLLGEVIGLEKIYEWDGPEDGIFKMRALASWSPEQTRDWFKTQLELLTPHIQLKEIYRNGDSRYYIRQDVYDVKVKALGSERLVVYVGDNEAVAWDILPED